MSTDFDQLSLPTRPSKTYLAGQLDALVEAHEAASAEADALKARIESLAAEKRRHEEFCAAIKDYLVAQQQRLEMGVVRGDVHRSDLGLASPSFSFDGKPEKIPDAFAKLKRELDKAACKSAFEKGELPKTIAVTRTAYVKFQRA